MQEKELKLQQKNIKKTDKSLDFSWFDLAKAILYLTDKNKKKYIFWNIVRLMTYFYAVIPPFVLGKMVDFFNHYKPGDSLTPFYFYIFLITLSGVVLLLIRSISKQQLMYIRNATYRNIRTKGFRYLSELDFKEARSSSIGENAQKIQNGMVSFKAVLGIVENKIFETVAVLIGVVGVFIFLRPVYVVFFLVYCAVFMLILVLYYKKIQYYSYRRNLAKEDASSIFIEGLNNILTLKVFNAERSFGKLLEKKEIKSERVGNEEFAVVVGQWRWFHLLNALSTGGFLLLVGMDVARQIITVGTIVILFSYVDKLIASAHTVIGIYQDFLGAKNGIARMMTIFWNNKKVVDGEKKFPKHWREMRLKNIAFTYKKELQDKFHKGVKKVDLEIRRNSKIGLAGKTGSGKSTLAKLLVGLYKIDSGEYLIGGVNFYDIKIEERLKNISIVLQESEMFNLSLRDNITLMHKFDRELFERAVRIAQLEEVIEKMPKGVDTVIGEKGYHLSGGERQRVGIARAIYRDAPIMIFDEATSSLDSRTEKLIQEGIEREMDKKTLIFIAHRITTLKNVDNIYVFKNGQIVEDGKYDELLNKKEGEFYRLFKK